MARQPNSGKEQSSKSSNEVRLDFYFLSLFPEVFEPILNASLLGKASRKGIVSYTPIQIRDFATDKHKTVDDTPYGGGAGMVMRVDVLHVAWKNAQEKIAAKNPPGNTATILLSPQGELFDQPMAKELAEYSNLIFVCGHYEGVDERFVELCVDREISIGNYVLTGGELPAMVLADAITRLRAGVVGNEESVTTDSLEGGLLKYPQYTRPRDYVGRSVPEILMSGNHVEIEKWRRTQMEERTRKKRPDLFKK